MNIDAADFPLDVTTTPTQWDNALATAGYPATTTARFVGTDTEGVIEEALRGEFCAQMLTVSETGDTSVLSNSDFADTRGADTTAPAVSTVDISDSETSGEGFEVVSDGDVVAVTFPEAVQFAADAEIWFLDDDGTVASLTLGGNATLTQNVADTTAFLSVTADPVIVEPGNTTATALSLAVTGLEVVNSIGITDAAGNDLAEVNVTAAAANTGVSTVDFTANAPLDASTVTTADFTTNSTTVTISSVSVTDNVITVTMSGIFATGDTVTLTANSVANTAGGNGPASNVTIAAA